MIDLKKETLIKSTAAGFFSIITISLLTFLTYKTELGIFLLASFGSSMVLLYGYPESPFAQPKNVFFWSFSYCISRFIFFIPYSSSNFYNNTDGSRIWCWTDDLFKCNSPTSWG